MNKKVYIFSILTIILIIIIFSITFSFKIRKKDDLKENIISEEKDGYEVINNNIKLKINNAVFDVLLYNNDTSVKLVEMLPLTIMMNELNGNEKYYYFDKPFSVDSETIDQINVGDIMLYGSDCLVLFYKNFKTTYNYTKVGKIVNSEGLEEVLSDDNIEVTFYK